MTKEYKLSRVDDYENQVKVIQSVLENLKQEEIQVEIHMLIDSIVKCFEGGGKLIFFGNGGSAMDGGHIAAEFTGRFLLPRPSLPAISLSDSVAATTSIGNDFGYDDVFSRQIQGLANERDIAIGLTTSGKSKNVLKGLSTALEKGTKTVIFTGDVGEIDVVGIDHIIRVPSVTTARIQEATLFLGHYIAGAVESKMYG